MSDEKLIRADVPMCPQCGSTRLTESNGEEWRCRNCKSYITQPDWGYCPNPICANVPMCSLCGCTRLTKSDSGEWRCKDCRDRIGQPDWGYYPYGREPVETADGTPKLCPVCGRPPLELQDGDVICPHRWGPELPRQPECPIAGIRMTLEAWQSFPRRPFASEENDDE